VTADTLEQARDALAREAWAAAYDGFAAAEPSTLTGRDLEGYADAAWWGSRLRESIEIRQRAYTAYAAEGDERGAGATAARIAIEHFLRGDLAVGGGFLGRAERHLGSFPEDAPERGYLAMIHASVARFGGDLENALTLSETATRLGRAARDADLVAMGVHVEGVVLIDMGRIDEGIALLDEAMAAVVAGGVSPYFTGLIYCSLISTCLMLSDVRRAGEWSDAAADWCATIPPDSPYPGMCRANRAEVARLRGAWDEALAEAMRASEELMVVEPGIAAAAYLQVAEVRRRTGDLVGAGEAYAKAHELGDDPQPGLALLRLAEGKTDPALAGVRAALDGEPRPPQRIRLLTAFVEIAIAAGEVDAARASAAELADLAATTATPVFAANAAEAEGIAHLAAGDLTAALERLRKATALWQELRLPYETGRARVTYGRALRAAGDEDGAELELRAALATFERLGARLDAEEARGLLREPASLPAGLTARELEVLKLVASGKTNRDIAVELVISEHTVGRHLQNIFGKIGVSSRSAATAFAFEHGLT
jgi:DNA-binding CsgD family transcriptional regulator